MKRGTESHPKMLELADMLPLDVCFEVRHLAAIGLLHRLWDWAADYAPRGDVGRFSNAAIARGICWPGDPDALIEALVKARWIDRRDQGRLVIHDWTDHAEDLVHIRLARAGERFVDGTAPKLTRLNEAEKKVAQRAFASNAHTVRTACAQETHTERTACAENCTAEAEAEAYTKAYANAESETRAPAREARARTRSARSGDSADSHRTTEPEQVGAICEAVAGQVKSFGAEGERMLIEKAVARAVVFEPGAGWAEWFGQVIGALYRASADGYGAVLDALERVEQAADPQARARKDIGEFRAPGRWLVKQLVEECRRFGVRWPDYPVARKAV